MNTQNTHAPLKHYWIVALKVVGGYVDGLHLRFSPAGNVIIGEPGTGKSTLLTLMRFVLGLAVPPSKQTEHESLLDANLGAGRVYVTIAIPFGGELTFSRAVGEDESRLESATNGATDARLTPDLFPTHFVGHGEFQLMATDGLARLDLLKRFAGDELRAVEASIAGVRRELEDNGAEVVRLDGEIQERADECADLPGQRARLEELKRAGGDNPVELNQANQKKALRERERMMIEAFLGDMEWLHGEAGKLVSVGRRRLSQVVDPEALRGENADLLAGIDPLVREASEALAHMAKAVGALYERGRDTFGERARTMANRHSHQDDGYREILGRHEQDAARAAERIKLERTVAVLSKTREKHDAFVEERAQVVAAGDRLRARLAELLARRLAVFTAACKRVTAALDERIELTMEEEAERSAYAALLKELLKGKRFETKDVDKLAGAITPHDLLSFVKAGKAEAIAEKMEQKTTSFAHRLVGALLKSPLLYKLETVEVHDIPKVKLKHGQYKDSMILSSGQRTGSFLSLILLERKGPFVADQPEDHTANRYLTEHLCPAFAEGQASGQYIIVTYNVNFPIIARTAKVIELQSNGSRAWVSADGKPVEVMDPMQDVLEGGREALIIRKDFYGV